MDVAWTQGVDLSILMVLYDLGFAIKAFQENAINNIVACIYIFY